MKYYREYKHLESNTDFDVEIEIDLDELAKALAARAFDSKSKKSTMANGDIKCKVIKNDPVANS